MTKRRMIDNAFFQSEGVGLCTMRQRLVMIGLFTLADDQGRMRGNPAWIKAQLFPYDDITPEEIGEDLDAIVEANDTLTRYLLGEREFIQLTNWWKYQNLQWAKPSDIPGPDGWEDRIRQMIYQPKRWVMTLNWPGVKDCTSYQPKDESETQLFSEADEDHINELLRFIPVHIATEEFIDMFREWANYHSERGKPLTIPTVRRQVKQFEKWGPEESARIMDYSISNNWTSLVEPKQSSGNGSDIEKKIMNHIQKYGIRQEPDFDAETMRIIQAAGGYRALCQMKANDIRTAIRAAT